MDAAQPVRGPRPGGRARAGGRRSRRTIATGHAEERPAERGARNATAPSHRHRSAGQPPASGGTGNASEDRCQDGGRPRRRAGSGRGRRRGDGRGPAGDPLDVVGQHERAAGEDRGGLGDARYSATVARGLAPSWRSGWLPRRPDERDDVRLDLVARRGPGGPVAQARSGVRPSRTGSIAIERLGRRLVAAGDRAARRPRSGSRSGPAAGTGRAGPGAARTCPRTRPGSGSRGR